MKQEVFTVSTAFLIDLTIDDHSKVKNNQSEERVSDGKESIDSLKLKLPGSKIKEIIIVHCPT